MGQAGGSTMEVPKTIFINIDCYQCGNKLEFPFRLDMQQAEYCYCQECQEGVQVCFNGEVLSIDRLEQE